MYYDEQVINGVLCHRGTPNGKWIPFTVEQLTARLQELKAVEQQRALDLAGLCVCNPFFIGVGTCVRCGGRYHPPSQ